MSLEIEPSNDGKSLLEVLESRGLNPPYQCREGVCGACTCKLISGEVEHKSDTLAYYDDENILLCSSRAKTTVVVSFLGDGE